MRIFALICLFFLSTTAVAQQPPKYWQQKLDYTIDVELNDTAHTLTGFLKLVYKNNSPDTLRYIWFHLWPNAYKNDKTAFSDQLLRNGRTDFYFSEKEEKGYINRLDFKVDNSTAVTEDHPQHIDIVKVLLPDPLAPGQQVTVTTPFHIKLPAFFSRLGHTGQQYMITQWYPQPAVYDAQGWHPMTYLDQGGVYSGFGNFEVSIRVPKDYYIASGGMAADEPTLLSLNRPQQQWPQSLPPVNKPKKQTGPVKKTDPDTVISRSSSEFITCRFSLLNATGFAWFAAKNWKYEEEKHRLPSGRYVLLRAYYQPWVADNWKNALQYMKQVVDFYSTQLGDYPYPSLTAVAAPGKRPIQSGYPGIVLLSTSRTEKALNARIAEAIGQNWFNCALGNNARRYPWLGDGLNSWVGEKYTARYAPEKNSAGPPDWLQLFLRQQISSKNDQPVNTPADSFSARNYTVISNKKTANWLKEIEKKMGQKAFSTAMKAYYKTWEFKHASAPDFQKSLEGSGNISLETAFASLDSTGPIATNQVKKRIKPTAFYNFRNTDKYQYLSFFPVAGYNHYDKLTPGVLIHNYQLPLPAFRFAVAPLYSAGAKKLNGIGQVSYHRSSYGKLAEWSLGIQGAAFSTDDYKDEGHSFQMRMQKLVPEIRFRFRPASSLSQVQKTLSFRTFFIREENLNYQRTIIGTDTSYTLLKKPANRYINQLRYRIENTRVLYPYSAEFSVEQMKSLIRAGFTGLYYFNYGQKKGGLQTRFFAGKIFYTGDNSLLTRFTNSRYHLNMTGPDGSEDYTYSNYYIGRNEFEGIESQQIMMRDGAFKVRTDMLSSKIGKTDDWLMSFNLVSDIPSKINPLQVLPFRIPLKVFVDFGSYADSWKNDKKENSSRFLYDAGFQLSLLRESVNIYIPILYSKEFRDYFDSTLGDKKFWKKISFSINFDVLKPSKLIPEVNL